MRGIIPIHNIDELMKANNESNERRNRFISRKQRNLEHFLQVYRDIEDIFRNFEVESFLIGIGSSATVLRQVYSIDLPHIKLQVVEAAETPYSQKAACIRSLARILVQYWYANYFYDNTTCSHYQHY